MIFALRAESEKSSVFGLKNPAEGLKKTVLAHTQFPCQRKPKLDQYNIVFKIMNQELSVKKILDI